MVGKENSKTNSIIFVFMRASVKHYIEDPCSPAPAPYILGM
jgi:hypothetical protein